MSKKADRHAISLLMEDTSCVSCLKLKATLRCGLCESSVCKSCARFLDDDSFSFLAERPKDLQHTTYCPTCFEAKVSAPLDAYNELMEKAGNVAVYLKNQSKETRSMKRAEGILQVNDCADRDEVQMRLAFQAVQAGYDALILVELIPTKVRSGAYQTTSWSATGVAAVAKPERKKS
jgi:hypothetical protein